MAEISIIGAGIGGLSAGIFLQRSGHNVTIYEQSATSGGNLIGWKRKEHTIDNCIHWLTGTNPLTKTFKLWQQIGAFNKNELYSAEYLYKCELNGQTVALYYDLDRTLDQMLKLSPVDRDEILSFTSAVKKVSILTGTVKSKNGGGDIIGDFINKIYAIPCLIKYYKLDLYELAQKFKHPLLQKFFTDYIDGCFGALALIITASTFCSGNGALPYGGSPKMAKNVTQKFLDLGGKIVYNKKATSVKYNKNKIESLTLSDGEQIKSDYFIFTGDPFIIYNEILNKKMPTALLKRYKNLKFQRFSAIHTAFSVDVTDLPFKGTYITTTPKKYANLINETRIKLKEYSYEPSFAPNGKTVIQTITFCNQGLARYYINLAKNKPQYNALKNKYSQAVKECIEQIFPTLKGKISLLDCWTPYTYYRYTGAKLGEFMSFTLPPKTLPKDLSNKVLGVKNAVIASQWLTVPGGLPNALNMGYKAFKTITLKERLKNIFALNGIKTAKSKVTN